MGFGRHEPLEFNPGCWYLTGAVIGVCAGRDRPGGGSFGSSAKKVRSTTWTYGVEHIYAILSIYDPLKQLHSSDCESFHRV